MKTILVPTDYSETADNAMHYALELAKTVKAKIILFHAYPFPIPTGDIPVLMVSPDELEKSNLIKIKDLEKKIEGEFPGEITVEHIVRAGNVTDEILTAAEEKEVDLIVMGVTGGGLIAETLMGSNTTALIKKTEIPVLVIPPKAKYKKIEKLVLAYDYKGKIKENVMSKIKTFAHLFNAQILVIDMVAPVEVTSPESTEAHLSIEKGFSDIKHSLYFPEGDDLEYQINSFVDSFKADWLIMIPHKNSFFAGLFHRRNTKKMAFHTHIPLLSLLDK